MTVSTDHICVCICTYKRPYYLSRLLLELECQNTEGRFTYSIVVVDNDRLQSARHIVSVFTEKSNIRAKYCVEVEQNIAMARNAALRNTEGDYIAFIDDDEFPIRDWLLNLFRTCHEYKSDGVLGPVKPYFEIEPPRWVVRGKFYERATYRTGFVINWRKGRTGNVLFRKKVFESLEHPFRPEFLTGEDQDFFRRSIERGFVFVWCNEAVAYEYVPPIRCKRKFMLKRALLRGQVSLNHPTMGGRDVIRAFVAVLIYTVILPFLLLLGQFVFMKYLVKIFDHFGRILAFFGFKPVKEKYVTE